MNVYDFDKTIYDGDSTRDFYLFCLRRHKKILSTVPPFLFSAGKFYIFKKGTKTEFKEKMYRFLRYIDTDKDLIDFWDSNISKIKYWYLHQQKEDDVIISASPEFLLEPVCQKLGIKYLMASKVDRKTGTYSGINCRDTEKVRRFYEVFPNGRIDNFYSDDYCDSPLAEISDKAFIVKGNKILHW